jgi:O-antigen/teichoic acid export membrane protein
MPGLEKYYREPLYRNSLILMLITGQSSLFNYVFWLLAGHMTSAAHVGLATAAISAAAMIVTLSRLGMDDSLVRFFPQSKDPGGFYNAMIAVMLLVTIVVMAGFFIGLRYFSPALMFLHEDLFSLAFAGYVFLTSVCDMQGSALVAIRRADLAFIQYGILVLRIPLLFILGSHGILGILVALDITYAIMLVAGVVLMYRKGISRDIHFDVGEVRKTLRFSIGNYTSTIVAAAPITLIPILIVNTIGAKEGAYF